MIYIICTCVLHGLYELYAWTVCINCILHLCRCPCTQTWELGIQPQFHIDDAPPVLVLVPSTNLSWAWRAQQKSVCSHLLIWILQHVRHHCSQQATMHHCFDQATGHHSFEQAARRASRQSSLFWTSSSTESLRVNIFFKRFEVVLTNMNVCRLLGVPVTRIQAVKREKATFGVCSPLDISMDRSACTHCHICMHTWTGLHAHIVRSLCTYEQVCTHTLSGLYAHMVRSACANGQVFMHTWTHGHHHGRPLIWWVAHQPSKAYIHVCMYACMYMHMQIYFSTSRRTSCCDMHMHACTCMHQNWHLCQFYACMMYTYKCAH